MSLAGCRLRALCFIQQACQYPRLSHWNLVQAGSASMNGWSCFRCALYSFTPAAHLQSDWIDTQPNDKVRPLGRWAKADRLAGSTLDASPQG
jgi:hypothetical protein